MFALDLCRGFEKYTLSLRSEPHREEDDQLLPDEGVHVVLLTLTQRSKPSDCVCPLARCPPACLPLCPPFLIALTSPVSRFHPHLRLIVLAPPSLINSALSSQSHSDGASGCVFLCSGQTRSPVLTFTGLAQLLILAGRTVGEDLAQFLLFLCSGTMMEGYYDNTNIHISQWVSPVQCGCTQHRKTQPLSCVCV